MDYILIKTDETYIEYPIVKNVTIQGFKDNIDKIDPFTWHKSEEGTEYLYIKETNMQYERKSILIIDENNADINVSEFPFRMMMEDNKLYIKQVNPNTDSVAFHNQKSITFENGVHQSVVQEGDVFLLDTMKLIIYNQKVVVCANTDSFQSNLLEISAIQNAFDGFPRYRRSPRLIKRVPVKSFEINKAPEKDKMNKSSLVQLIVTPVLMMIITVGISIVMKRGLFVIMSIATTVFGIIASVSKYISDKKEWKEKNEKIKNVYELYLLEKRKEINKAKEQEIEAWQYNNPTLKDIEKMVIEYSNRIYERNALDEDFLQIPVGTITDKSSFTIKTTDTELELEKNEFEAEVTEIKKIFGTIQQKPVVIDLKKAHLGLVGDKKNIQEQLKILVAQMTFFHSYHDLQFITIFDEKYNNNFKWMNWYPHFKIHAINVFGSINSEKMRDQVLGSMHQIIKDRKIKRDESKKEGKYLPHYVFIIDEPKLIMDHAIMEYLDKEGEELGFSIIYTTYLQANLPENIGTVILIENSKQATFLLNNKEIINKKIVLNHVGDVNLERMARDLSVLIHEQGIVSQIPESITFFDMYGIEDPEQLQVEARWKKNESHKSLAVPLGVRSADDYVYLNLHEKAHGPHGLVAGTTGSGKSEIVQSYILSLAVNFHPYEVGFLLIDYKGGGMAGLFKKLPHLLGTITNLDGNESLRAMASIKSELARRQRVFSENNVNHINAYNKLFKLGKVEEPIPHLFLISDEFAELKKEQPEFMDELISTARIGRSLGVHLILATQKPTGVVNDQIWTNSKFKLALKVQNEADSKEIIKTSDAAFITQPGRAYLQVGNNEIYELFQSAWSGAVYTKERTETSDNRVYIVNELGQGELVNQDLSEGAESEQIRDTQLDVVVEHVKQVFDNQHLDVVKRPWLPSLSPRMVSPYTLENLDNLQVENREAEVMPLNLKIAIGMVDIPEEQKQVEYCQDLMKDGNLVFFSSAGYGKTTFLTTVVLSLALQNSLSNLNFYILDYGNNGLVPLNGIPHTADYINFDDDERLSKFLRIIDEEIKNRKKQMAGKMVQNFEVYNQSCEEPMKAIVIVVDNFDVVKEKGFELEEYFTKLSRDGIGLGIYLIVTATRMNGIRYATLNNFKNKIAGYLFDGNEAVTIVGRSNYALPEIKGRALVKLGSVSLMQLYTMVNCDSEVHYNLQLKKLIQKILSMYPTQKAPRIPILPEHFTGAMLEHYAGDITNNIQLGLDLQTVELQGISRTDTPFIIIGETSKGKTNMLKIILEQIVGTGNIQLFDTAEMGLFSYKGRPDVTYIEEHNIEDFAQNLEMECMRRKSAFKNAISENSKLNPKMFYKELPPYYVIVDDADVFIEKTKEHAKDNPLFMKDAAEVGILIIMTVYSTKLKGYDELSKWVKTAVNGLVLSAQGTLNIFPVMSTRDYPGMGEGLLFSNGSYIKIKLPKFEESGETE